MKRLYVFFFFIYGVLGVWAQELVVKSFSEQQTDLAASIYPRKDNNDAYCALVKVQLPSPDATFEGVVMGDVVYKTSEYWVYMPKGSKRLIIKHEGYYPLVIDFSQYGLVSLESKTTYLAVVSGISQGVSPSTRTLTGWISIDSDPAGALMYINDEFVGITPNDVKRPYGTYTYRLDKPKYHSAYGTIELDSGKWEDKIRLSPAYGSISITGVSDAVVLLDGNVMGENTPCTIENVSSGGHIVIVKKEGLTPQHFEIVVNDGQTTSIVASSSESVSRVSIKSLLGAEIWIDNQLKGLSNITEELRPGYYDVEVRKDNHRPVSRQLHVVSGLPLTITMDPIPIYGSLDVVSTPRGANVAIDGQSYGKTPITISDLFPGEHTVELSLSGFATQTRVVSISENQLTEVSATLPDGVPIVITVKDMDARIYVDDVDVGTTPYMGRLSYGQHNIYAKIDNQRSFSRKINVGYGDSILPPIELAFYRDTVFSIKGVKFAMIYVQGGSFVMGGTFGQGGKSDSDEIPAHQVSLSDYFIGQTEVSQQLWDVVMGSNPSRFKSSRFPVENVSWDDCQEFIRKLNVLTGMKFSLPTEAQWEYACRGGCESRGYRYSGSDTLGDVAFYDANSGGQPHHIKAKFPNELGLYDMCGNVFEWCSDWYGKYNDGHQVDPTGPSTGTVRVCRGGSRYSGKKGCRPSFRFYSNPSYCHDDIGLRLCLSEL